MWTIGELAARSGVSRRMLRHWNDIGLLDPTSVDEHTGYRWYAASQVGRVRAIASLRAVGFGLDEVANLLTSPLSEERLVELLLRRESALRSDIETAQARLSEVQRRLAAIQKGRQTTMDTIELIPLPPLRLTGLRTEVDDEAEIGTAVETLVADLTAVLTQYGSDPFEVVITYFGPPGDGPIEISAGIESSSDLPGLTDIDVPGTDRGVSVSYENGSGGIGDAWITLDSALTAYDLRTTGVYRQHITTRGPWRLQAPVEASTVS